MSGKKGRKFLRKLLNSFHAVGLDTNLFVYYLDKDSPFYSQAVKIFKTIVEKKINAITSIITLAELLSFRASQPMLDRLENELFLIPQLAVIEVARDIAKEAGRIRREYGFRLPDSIQLATALHFEAQAFVTNDDNLEKFKELSVILLKKL